MSSSLPADDSPTELVKQLREQREDAAQRLWQAYFEKLVRLARTRLPERNRRVSDEEDLALSAFHSFCRGVEQGRFPQISNRDDLWKLLVTITLNKACHQVRDAGRQRRGGGWNRLDSADSVWQPLEQQIGREPTPEFAAQIVEQVDRLLGLLPDQTLANIAVWKLEGYSSEEIASRLDVSVRTVERKLKLIRSVWGESAEEESAGAFPE